MKLFARCCLLLILLCSTAGCAITEKFGPYQGKVLDAETREPIEGAAVLVVFYTEEYGPAGSIMRYADAVETMTDRNGEYRIAAHRVTTFRLLQSWRKYGYFTIFKPGYGCYPTHKDVKPIFVPNGTLPERDIVIIEMPKLKTIQERLENTRCFTLSTEVPIRNSAGLRNLVNQERLSL